MKILNFTAVEILPSLLNKTKKQTIRPAWKKPEFVSGISVNGSPKYDSNCEDPIIEKPARFSVGEQITLMWKQRSKFKYFCPKCGTGIYSCGGHFSPRRCCKNDKFFPKVIGEAVITEVFRIKMGYMIIEDGKTKQGYIDTNFKVDNKTLAKMDGFKSATAMFNWFNKRYNLSRPKPFWAYRWKWL